VGTSRASKNLIYSILKKKKTGKKTGMHKMPMKGKMMMEEKEMKSMMKGKKK
jgi:hypothetical protein